MKKSFTPSMSQAQVQELDSRRGFGDVGKYTNPSPISRKEPWNVKTPDHTPRDQEVIEPEADPQEGQPEAEMQSPDSTNVLKSWLKKKTGRDFGKPVPERKGGEEKKDYMSRLVSFNRDEGKPEDQAVAVAGHESGVYKGECSECHNPDCDHDHDEDDMGKALNSRMLAIPRPMGAYDPFQIQRSATTIPSDVTSKLPKPEGFAPAVRHTLDDVSNRDLTIKPYWEKTTKSCMVHGISYDVQKGCYPCTVTKSMSCSECGEQKVKRPGGGMAQCPGGHDEEKDASY